jgi:hypothetical protein
MKRKTTKHRRQSRQSVLEVRVMSPRIAWFGFLGSSADAKIACVLAVLTGIGWGVWRGIQHAFYQNPDFSLKVIDLNPNPVIDELGVAESPASTSPPAQPLRRRRERGHRMLGRPCPASPTPASSATCPARWWCGSPPHAESMDFLRHRRGRASRKPAAPAPCWWIRRHRLPLPRAAVGNRRQAARHRASRHRRSRDPPGAKIPHPELAHCFHCSIPPARRIPRRRSGSSDPPGNDWSLLLVTRGGTAPPSAWAITPRQIESLRAALDHAGEKGYVIDTINLIPKYNIPITVRDESASRRGPSRFPNPAPPMPAKPAAPAISPLLNRN